MPVLIRLALWAMAAGCCWGVASTMGKVAEVASSCFSPFGMLAGGILVAAIGYAAAQLRRR